MGRSETPVDPRQGPLQEFAHELQVLRRRAGEPTYRTMARMAGLSPSVLSQAAKGRRLPTLQVTVGFVKACGCDEVQQRHWQSRWEEIRDELNTAAPDVPDTVEETAPPAPGIGRLLPVLALGAVALVVAAVTITLAVTGPERSAPAVKAGPTVKPIADGTDPYVNSCGHDQQPLERQPIYRADGSAYGYVVLFYSARCAAAWGYVLGPNSPHWTVHINAHRMTDSADAPSEFRGQARPNSWGNVLSTRTGCVRAEAWIDNGPRARTSCWSPGGRVVRSPAAAPS